MLRVSASEAGVQRTSGILPLASLVFVAVVQLARRDAKDTSALSDVGSTYAIMP